MISQDREVIPADFIPTNYDLSIFNIDFGSLEGDKDLDGNRVSPYDGKVIISYRVDATADSIQLNARNLKINDTVLRYSSGKTETETHVKKVIYDQKRERVEFQLHEKISPTLTPKFELEIDFSGFITSNMDSFYRSKYTDQDGKNAVMLSTQFEAIAARQAFPCVDEPNRKATFDFKITVPTNWTALSNMPVASSKTIGDGKKKAVPFENLKVVTFEQTPIMSTYLLAWAAGDFEYIETYSTKAYGLNKKRIPVRVYTTRGLAEKSGKIGLDTAAYTLDLFSEIFDIEYPLPKLDLIAVHELSGNAMENFGLITFRATALLFDAEGDIDAETRVCYVVSHEMAHQWFGNLVTMDWWEGLWLNEGFATYCGWLAVDKMHPEWDVFSKFVIDSLQTALQLDGLRSSHPVEVPIRSGQEVEQIFDAISYLKGASIIRMLSSGIGPDTFIKGVSIYLKTHKYGNAVTSDLWKGLSEASGADVGSMIGTWTEKIGFPLVSVAKKDGHTIVEQQRFLSTGDVKPEDDQTLWWIPLSIYNGEDQIGNVSLDRRVCDISEFTKNSKFIKLNKNQIGLYHVNYSMELLTQIIANADKLSREDKVGLLSDTKATAVAGHQSVSSLLTLIEAFRSDSDYFVWSQMLNNIRSLQATWNSDRKIREAINKFLAYLIEPRLELMTWEVSPSESATTIQLRSLLMLNAAEIGLPKTVEIAQEKFTRYLNGDKTAIHASLREAVFEAVIKHSSGNLLKKAYDYMLEQARNPSSVDMGELAASTLGAVNDKELIDRSMRLIIAKEGILPHNLRYLAIPLARNPNSQGELWNFFKNNWASFTEKYGSNKMIIGGAIRIAVTHLSTIQAYDDVKQFFRNKDQSSYNKILAQALETVKSKAEWSKRDQTAISEWLSTQGFM